MAKKDSSDPSEIDRPAEDEVVGSAGEDDDFDEDDDLDDDDEDEEDEDDA